MTTDPRHIRLRLGLARGIALIQSGRAMVGDVRRGTLDLLISAMGALGDTPYREPDATDPEAAIGAVVEAALARGVSVPRAIQVFNRALERGVRPGG